MSYFKNNDINIYASRRWEKLSEKKKSAYYEYALKKWQEQLPFYAIEDSHTLTKRHGPFLLSITLLEGDYGYIPSFSIRTLYSQVDIGKNAFVKFLQSPEYNARIDFFNDTFSGMVSYFSIDETFDEIFENFKQQIPLAVKKEVTLFDINQWMEYCILGEKAAFLPQYMLSHLHALRYFNQNELADNKYQEYSMFIEDHMFEAKEGYLVGIDEKYQTLDYWLEEADLVSGEIVHRVNENLKEDNLLELRSLNDFPEYPITDLEIPIKSEFISANERYNWALDHMEIVEVTEKEKWAEHYLLFDYFKKIPDKPYLRTMYREHLESLLKRFIEQEDYFFDLETEGHIAVRRLEDEYELSFFHRDETNTLYKKEFAFFQHSEYIELLTIGVNAYLATYFNLISEKKRWYQLLDEAKAVKLDVEHVYH